METIVRTFDLYNTTFYWVGYTNSYTTEMSVASAYYASQFSSNVIGSQIDFFNKLAGNTSNSNTIVFNATLDSLPLLWSKYWWDEATYYSNPIALSAIRDTSAEYYQDFSDSIGNLNYIETTKPYNGLITNLLIPGLDTEISDFYQTNLTNTTSNSEYISLVSAEEATTDTQYVVDAGSGIQTTINNAYPVLSDFLPFNTNIIGNLITPNEWRTNTGFEGSAINVDLGNNIRSGTAQLILSNLKAVNTN